MALNLDSRIRQALAEIMQDALGRGEPVELTGFGTFRVTHRSAELVRDAEGLISIRPPQRSVVFEPDAR